MKKKLDKRTLKQVLKETNGSITKSKKILEQAGYAIDSLKCIYQMIDDDVELKAIVEDPSPLKSEPPTATDVAVRATPASTEVEKQKAQDEALSTGMKGAGFNEEEIEKFGHFSDFVAAGFNKTVDFTYGVMVKGVMNLQQRAEWIDVNVLQKTTGFSEEEKLLWQKEYTSIMDTIGKFATITNNAALIRVKAHAIGSPKGGDRREKKLRRLKKAVAVDV